MKIRLPQELSTANTTRNRQPLQKKNKKPDLYSKPIVISDQSFSDTTASTSESNDPSSASSPVALDIRDEYIEFLISEESLFWLNHPPEESERNEEDVEAVHECSAATCRMCEAKRQRGPVKYLTSTTKAMTEDDEFTPVKRRSPAYEQSCRACLVDDTVEL